MIQKDGRATGVLIDIQRWLRFSLTARMLLKLIAYAAIPQLVRGVTTRAEPISRSSGPEQATGVRSGRKRRAASVLRAACYGLRRDLRRPRPHMVCAIRLGCNTRVNP